MIKKKCIHFSQGKGQGEYVARKVIILLLLDKKNFWSDPYPDLYKAWIRIQFSGMSDPDAVLVKTPGNPSKIYL